MDDNNNDEKRNVEGSNLVAAAAASITDEEKGSRTGVSLRRRQQQEQGPKRFHSNNNNHKNTDKETSIRQYTSAPTDHDQDEFEPSAVEQQDGEHSNNINIQEEEEENFRDEAGEEEQQHLVEDEASHQPTQQQQQQQQQGLASSWWQACFLPDRVPRLFGIPLLDGLFAVKFAKFVVVTMAGIALMHWFVRRMAWEHRSSFTLTDFWRYESTLVVVDALFYFTVGRMHQQRGVDHLAFLVTAGMAGLYASGITNFRFLQQSVTLYAMHCRWSWELWLFVLCLVPLIVTLILWHVQYAVQRGVFISKLLEMAGLSCLLLLLPSATSPYLHLHHWFAGWLLGMHANFNVWWSRATLAWCWGLYMNGIAVYGRDPVLTCGYTLFLSRQQGCPYLDCYLDGLNHPPPENSTVPPVQEMKTPDWRNCSADAYHPKYKDHVPRNRPNDDEDNMMMIHTNKSIRTNNDHQSRSRTKTNRNKSRSTTTIILCSMLLLAALYVVCMLLLSMGFLSWGPQPPQPNETEDVQHVEQPKIHSHTLFANQSPWFASSNSEQVVSQASSPPPHKTKYNGEFLRPVRVVYGIMSHDQTLQEKKRRHLIRNTFLKFYSAQGNDRYYYYHHHRDPKHVQHSQEQQQQKHRSPRPPVASFGYNNNSNHHHYHQSTISWNQTCTESLGTTPATTTTTTSATGRRRTTTRTNATSTNKRSWICSFNDLLQGRLEHPEHCRMAYAFVVGANPKGPTLLLEYNDSYPLTVASPSSRNNHTRHDSNRKHNSIQNSNQRHDDDYDDETESDVVYLNIRENLNYGKIPTWFRYASVALQQQQQNGEWQCDEWDYIYKADTDTIVFPQEFFQFLDESNPTPEQRPIRDVYGGSPIGLQRCHKLTDPHCRLPREFPGTQYMQGGGYFVSTNVAALMTSQPVASFVVQTSSSSTTTSSIPVESGVWLGSDNFSRFPHEDIMTGLLIFQLFPGNAGDTNNSIKSSILHRINDDPFKKGPYFRVHGVKNVRRFVRVWNKYVTLQDAKEQQNKNSNRNNTKQQHEQENKKETTATRTKLTT